MALAKRVSVHIVNFERACIYPRFIFLPRWPVFASNEGAAGPAGRLPENLPIT